MARARSRSSGLCRAGAPRGPHRGGRRQRSAEHRLARDHQRLVALLQPAQMRRRPLGGAGFEQTIEGAALHLRSPSPPARSRPAMLADLWRWRMDSDTVDGAMAQTAGRRIRRPGWPICRPRSHAPRRVRVRARRAGDGLPIDRRKVLPRFFPVPFSIMLVLLAGCTAHGSRARISGRPAPSSGPSDATTSGTRARAGRAAFAPTSTASRGSTCSRTRPIGSSSIRATSFATARRRAVRAAERVRRLQRKDLHARPRSGRSPGRDDMTGEQYEPAIRSLIRRMLPG